MHLLKITLKVTVPVMRKLFIPATPGFPQKKILQHYFLIPLHQTKIQILRYFIKCITARAGLTIKYNTHVLRTSGLVAGPVLEVLLPLQQ